MKNKIDYFVVIVFLLLSSCTNVKKYSITGHWKENDGKVIYLQRELEDNKTFCIDSTIVNDGIFRFSGQLLQIEKLTVVAGTEKIDVIADAIPIVIEITPYINADGKKSSMYNTVTKGSKEQEVLQKGRELSRNSSFIQLGGMMAMSEVQNDSVKIDSIWKVTQRYQEAMLDTIKTLVTDNLDSYATAYTIKDECIKLFSVQQIDEWFSNLSENVKNSHPGELLKNRVTILKNTSVGNVPSDIALPSPMGDTIKLSSLKGQYVLLDFWASWCAPCIAEVPNMKEIYDKFHSQGFEIYSVSLDEKTDAWQNAIRKNDMNWIHVSSLKGWQCSVIKTYNIIGIPQMYLLDKNGVILDKDLRGEKLKKRISQLFPL